jgi:hypothetical protein
MSFIIKQYVVVGNFKISVKFSNLTSTHMTSIYLVTVPMSIINSSTRVYKNLSMNVNNFETDPRYSDFQYFNYRSSHHNLFEKLRYKIYGNGII